MFYGYTYSMYIGLKGLDAYTKVAGLCKIFVTTAVRKHVILRLFLKNEPLLLTLFEQSNQTCRILRCMLYLP